MDDLSVKRAIDAACDRFEAAWQAGQRPKIEGYLAPIAPSERPLYLRELLLTELALRPDLPRETARQEYLGRFGAYAPVVEDVFSNARAPRKTDEPVVGDRVLDDLVIAVRRRLRSSAVTLNQSNNADASRDDELSAGESSADMLVWRLLARHARLANGGAPEDRPQQAARLEAVTRNLLDAFPPSRRAILASVLLGTELSKAATLHGVTQRTVESTHRAAVDLLSRDATSQPG